jgi:hypothetical protein
MIRVLFPQFLTGGGLRAKEAEVFSAKSEK